MADQIYHPALGAVYGGLQATQRASEQANYAICMEAIGGGFGGFAAGTLHAVATNEGYGSEVVPGALRIGTYGTIKSEAVLELQQTFRSIATLSAQKAERATGNLTKVGYRVAELLMWIAAGAVIGFPAGYIAHLAAQSPDPKEFLALPSQ